MPQDLDLLQGTWTVTTLEVDGQSMPAAMLGDDSRGDGESEAGAAILGGKMREEELVFVLGRNAVSGIGHADFHGV